MTIVDAVLAARNRRGDRHNVEAAESIVRTNDTRAIRDLIGCLSHADRAIQGDCIKILYEVAERKPSLLALHAGEFFSLLESRNNRMQWGAMTVLAAVAPEVPALMVRNLDAIVAAADTGSVITRDRAVRILMTLSGLPKYSGAFLELLRQLKRCPVQQLPMYAEGASPVIDARRAVPFLAVLGARVPEVPAGSKRKRLERAIAAVQDAGQRNREQSLRRRRKR